MSMPEGGAGGDHSGGQLGDAGTDTFPKLLLQNSAQRGGRPAIREKFRGIWRTVTWRELAEEAALLRPRWPRGFAAGRACRLSGRQSASSLCGDVCRALARRHRGAALSARDGRRDRAIDAELRGHPCRSPRTRSRSTSCSRSCTRCPTIRCIVFDKERGMRHYKQPRARQLRRCSAAGAGSPPPHKRDFLRGRSSRAAAARTPSFLFFTSGTTGPAKGVVLTHAALIDRARWLRRQRR